MAKKFLFLSLLICILQLFSIYIYIYKNVQIRCGSGRIRNNLAFRVRIQNSVFRIRGSQLLTSVAARHSPLDPEKKDAKEVQTKYILSFRIEAKVSKQTS